MLIHTVGSITHRDYSSTSRKNPSASIFLLHPLLFSKHRQNLFDIQVRSCYYPAQIYK
jgi:hypothetical protein